MAFDITFLGALGGPIEASTCGILVKPLHVTYQQILQSEKPAQLLAVDAGLGALLLSKIIANEHQAPRQLLDLYGNLHSHVESYVRAAQIFPFAGVGDAGGTIAARDLARAESGASVSGGGSVVSLAARVLQLASTFIISHPHLDHIQGLVLNSAWPHLQAENQHNVPEICGLAFTVGALQRHVFNGVIWPNLVAAGQLRLKVLDSLRPHTTPDGSFHVTMFDLHHGPLHLWRQNESDSEQLPLRYPLSAFLVQELTNGSRILVFGDFEPDLVLGGTANSRVWAAVAPYIDDGLLRAVIMECSSPTVELLVNLYGHMMPAHVIAEFLALRRLTAAKHLGGLQVVITHVKDISENDPRRLVLSELEALNEHEALGLKITMALSGLLIRV